MAKMNLKNKRIGVLYGGWSAEREISIKSGLNVIAILKEAGYNAVPIDIGRNFIQKIKRAKIDIAFIALHGPFGEDGTIQAILEKLKIPYTGSGILASALAINKILTKKILQWYKLPTPEWEPVTKSAINSFSLKLKYPVVVKPSRQGSTIGISIVNSKDRLESALRKAFRYDKQLLIEKYISGRELTVGILNGKALPVVEILPTISKFYDYSAKYIVGGSKHIVPAQLPKKIYKSAQRVAEQAFKVIGCTAVARVDLMLGNNGKICILEINTIPGMTETSLLPEAGKADGISPRDLILKITESSLKAR
ncbi:MAG: hypothetical protein AUJ85_01345 [Elusimicrobia bacterium CG1_02_37_114]|nr:MAG: hypothetical protein AUJ85_01345 [Elusimicrobia bacterium CG1_02_37_114]PIV52253.1 MAG: D-alanine--D-alanine ligase [Elusimicrobia bacterium CG02_land_8_20_14_3_00_37_13]PIZ13705.1 MAG: D-alanine--D-alanine ligase [Elusimicrobia bacterium CG_4_10_14_0_8_um_filter_37_32]